jgi:hypothetical protein
MRKLLILSLLCASLSAHAQVILRNATAKNSTTGQRQIRNGAIFVVFPPASSSPDYADSRAAGSWWDNSLVDGVTVQLSFDSVSQINAASVGAKQFYVPTTSPGGTGSNCDGKTTASADTDTCVIIRSVQAGTATITLAAPVFYPFDWTATESTSSPGINMWFQATPGAVRKIVNLLDFSQSNGSLNGSTPSFVVVPAYVNLFAPARQDVMNALQSVNTCPNQYTGQPGLAASRTASSIATVTNNNHGLNTGDTIYTVATAGSGTFAQYTTGTGASITVTDANHYTYDTGVSATDTATITAVAASQSWIVPYELPFLAARQAFLKAVHLHYSAAYSNAAGGTAAQLGYWRNGQGAGGEVVPFCTAEMQALTAPYTLATDTATVPGVGDNCFSGGGCNTWGWVSYYKNDLKFQETLNSYMRLYNSINTGNTGGPQNMGYPATEYPLVTQRTNGSGLFDGVGEQGAALSDITAYFNNPTQAFTLTNPPNICNNYGCGMVQNSYASGMPMEIQQISISAYDDSNCTTQAKNGTSKCGVPSSGNGGDSGDLRQWLKFYSGLPASDGTNTATLTGDADTLELYYKDAALALSVNFCVLTGGPPATGCSSAYSDIGGYTWYAFSTGPAYQFNAMQAVGLGTGCVATYTAASAQTLATGDCSYAAALKSFHGKH